MNFKAYDILSTVVPGFLAVLVGLNVMDIPFDKDMVIAYTAMAFLLGYILNTAGSWLEDFYFFTWGGKPSNKLLSNKKGIWKIKFYEGINTRNKLEKECENKNATTDQLFHIAMRKANGNQRVEDFNATYAFSRTILTVVFIGSIFLLVVNINDWRYYAILIPSVVICWLRCKQRAYYWAREVLNVYLKPKGDEGKS